MKLVSESYQEFKQGGNPYKKLKLGRHRIPSVGDVFILNTNIKWSEMDNWEPTIDPIGLKKRTNIKIKEIDVSRFISQSEHIGCLFVISNIDPAYSWTYWISYEQLIKFTS